MSGARWPLLALLLPLFVNIGACAHVSQDRRELDAVIEQAIAGRSVPGAAVAIASGETTVYNRTFGVASLESREAVQLDTTFRLGSISKLITAVAIMRLVQEGRIRLDSPITQALPGRTAIRHLPPSVTVATLLNHTSGIGEHSEAELLALVTNGVTDADFAGVLAQPLVYEPGRGWSYSNVPYRVLSWLVEEASGRSFDEYVTRELAPSLGLRTLRSCDEPYRRQAVGYLSDNSAYRPEPAYAIRGLLGEGGLCAAAADLVQLPHALLTSGWISAPTLAEMLEPTVLLDGVRVDYGLGVRRGMLGPLSLWGHTGSGLNGGWAALAYYPERRTTIVVLANGSGGTEDAVTLQAKVAAAYFRTPALVDRAVASETRQAMAGRYSRGGAVCVSHGPDGVFRRRERDGAPLVRLLRQDDGSFGRSDYPLDRYVFQIEGGRAIAHAAYYDGFFAELWLRREGEACSDAPNTASATD